jgi:hypothetical protein
MGEPLATKRQTIILFNYLHHPHTIHHDPSPFSPLAQERPCLSTSGRFWDHGTPRPNAIHSVVEAWYLHWYGMCRGLRNGGKFTHQDISGHFGNEARLAPGAPKATRCPFGDCDGVCMFFGFGRRSPWTGACGFVL